MYRKATTTTHLHEMSQKVYIKRGIRQGDSISPTLFTVTIEQI